MSFCKNEPFFTGINYWASHAAIHMWSQWNAAAVEEDFRKLQQAGITVLRVFPLWPVFQPLSVVDSCHAHYEYRFGEEPLPNTEAGRAGVSEEACMHFAEFCALADKYGLKLLVALLTGHMSFRLLVPPAFQNRSMMSDPEVIKWELRYVRYFVRRFRDQKCIVAWDLGNEVNCIGGISKEQPDAAYVWVSAISDAIRSNDPDRPVVSGMDAATVRTGAFNITETAELVDVMTCHPYNIFQTPSEPLNTIRAVAEPAFRCRLNEQIGGKPTYVQEFGAIGYQTCTEKTEADFYRGVLFSAWAHGCYGTMWWCAFDQGTMDYAPYDWNNIGSDYGFFRADGTAKPIADENVKFNAFLTGLPFDRLPPHITDGVCLVSRDCPLNTLRACNLLAQQANISLTFADALAEIPDAPLYFMPSITHNHAIYRRNLVTLLEKVKEGAVLYLSLSGGLFRWLPEISGVRFGSRATPCGPHLLQLPDGTLPINGGFVHDVAQTDAEPILFANDRPVFFRHTYGKGTVYLMSIPLEESLGNSAAYFSNDTQPHAEEIYRMAAKSAPNKHAICSNNRLVCLTEHPLSETQRIAVAINYSGKPQNALLQLQDGWKLSQVYRGTVCEGMVRLMENDAAVFVLTKESFLP